MTTKSTTANTTATYLQLRFRFNVHLTLGDLLTKLLHHASDPFEVALLQIYLRADARPKPVTMLENRRDGVVFINHGLLHPVYHVRDGGGAEGGERRQVLISAGLAVAVVYSERESDRSHRTATDLTDLSWLEVWFLQDLCAQGGGDDIAGFVGEFFQIRVDALFAAADFLAEFDCGRGAEVWRVVGGSDELEE